MPPHKVFLWMLLLAFAAARQDLKKPNIILVLVDDQDATLNSTHPRYIKNLNELVIKKGVEFSNYFVHTPVCCPSRATLLTGRHAHSTNFTDVLPPYGGYSYWKRSGLESRGYLPSWLQQQGYRTYYVGKLFVEYAVYNYNPPPANWTDIDALVLPFVFNYTHPVFSRNGGTPRAYPGPYSTDVIADKACAQIRAAAARGRPFFLQVAPIAPHDSLSYDPNMGALVGAEGLGNLISPPVPAARHASLYRDVTLPQAANFNEGEATMRSKPAWLRTLPPLVAANISRLNEYYRQRLRSLAAVDEMLAGLVKELEAAGQLDNTYIIYTGDNGFHIGAHRMAAGKETPYEEDIRVPFYIRGPGLKQGVVNPSAGSHVDLAATLVTLAGGQPPPLSDGQPLPLAESAEQPAAFAKPQQSYDGVTALEYWGHHLDQITGKLYNNFTWKAVRARIGGPTNTTFKYAVWCSGERELFDLTHDPWELTNLAAPGAASPHHTPADLARIAQRLDAFLSAWYTCQGAQCVVPLRRVLPQAGRLQEALQPRHDAAFSSLPRFRFKECLGYFSYDNEVGAFDAQIRPKQPPTPAVDWGGAEFVPGHLRGFIRSLALQELVAGHTSLEDVMPFAAALRGQSAAPATPATPQPDAAVPTRVAAEAAAASAKTAAANSSSSSKPRQAPGKVALQSKPGRRLLSTSLLSRLLPWRRHATPETGHQGSQDCTVAAVEAFAVELPQDELEKLAARLARSVNKQQ